MDIVIEAGPEACTLGPKPPNQRGIAMKTKRAQRIELRANPCAVFERDDSAISLHARQRWMNGAGQARSKSRRLVREIAASQQPDGSWEERTSVTIRNMLALWLLGDAPEKTLDRGIDWLTQLGQPVLTHKHYYGMYFRIPNENVTPLHHMDDTPFTPGCTGLIKSGAAMFFACEYGREDEEHIALAFESARKRPADPGNEGRWCSPGCGENLFHAFTVHPKLSNSDAMRRYLGYLTRQQQPSGRFGNRTPFLPVVWSLAKLRQKSARDLLEHALPAIASSQRKDGTWGQKKHVLNAYLVLDALERAGVDAN